MWKPIAVYIGILYQFLVIIMVRMIVGMIVFSVFPLTHTYFAGKKCQGFFFNFTSFKIYAYILYAYIDNFLFFS